MVSGLLVALEGLDGSGKSTQLELVGIKLRNLGYDVITTQEPSKGRIGKLLRIYLKDQNSSPEIDGLLFAADRVEHYKEIIKPNIQLGKIVLTDRYKASSIAYQGAHGGNIEWLIDINSKVPEPDLTIYLAIDLDESVKRINKSSGEDIEKFENINFLKKAEDIYKSIMNDSYKTVNTDRNEIEIADEIVKLIANRFDS